MHKTHQPVRAIGEYFDRVNGGPWRLTRNLLPDEGLAHIMNVAFGSTAKPAGYYLAIHGGGGAPADNWTAATYPAAAGEIVSLTEGHILATRPKWVPGASSAGAIDNVGNEATFTIATAGTLNVTGAALLTSDQRGGTTGTLISAILFPTPRQFQDGDTWELGYRLTLTR